MKRSLTEDRATRARSLIVATVLLALAAAGCTSAGTGQSGAGTAVPPAAASATTDTTRADADLILLMYGAINDAFQANADDGVRAMIATQYPGDLVDVDFARCVNAIVPGATTLPPDKRLHFVPNIATMTLDPGYTVTSDHVKALQPTGRVYVTDVEINDGGKPAVHSRHQVIMGGQAYQFSSC